MYGVVAPRVYDALTAEAQQQNLDLVIDTNNPEQGLLWFSKSAKPCDLQAAVLGRLRGTAPPAAISSPAQSGPSSQEETDWQRADAQGTASAYKAFLAAHPASSRVRVISGNAQYSVELATGIVGEGGGAPKRVIVSIGDTEISVGLSTAKQMGLVQEMSVANMDGKAMIVKDPGQATAYVTERNGRLSCWRLNEDGRP